MRTGKTIALGTGAAALVAGVIAAAVPTAPASARPGGAVNAPYFVYELAGKRAP